MRVACTALSAVVASAVAVAPAAACSIRGQYCGYPFWAANAFEDPWGRVSEGARPYLPNLRYGYVQDGHVREAYAYRPATRRHVPRRGKR